MNKLKTLLEKLNFKYFTHNTENINDEAIRYYIINNNKEFYIHIYDSTIYINIYNHPNFKQISREVYYFEEDAINIIKSEFKNILRKLKLKALLHL